MLLNCYSRFVRIMELISCDLFGDNSERMCFLAHNLPLVAIKDKNVFWCSRYVRLHRFSYNLVLAKATQSLKL